MAGIIGKVKPLEWKEADSSGTTITAKGVYKNYYIYEYSPSYFEVRVDDKFIAHCTFLDEAKTKCFALHIGDLLPFLEI